MGHLATGTSGVLKRALIARTSTLSPSVSPSGLALRPLGDKSLSHRALIFSALAEGTSEITGLLESEDVLATAAALGALGVEIQKAPAPAAHGATGGATGGGTGSRDAFRGSTGKTTEEATGGATDAPTGVIWRVSGVGIGGLTSPAQPLDLGNSGTGARLLLGALAGNPLMVRMVGDESLSARPFLRVLEPLAAMGAMYRAAEGGRLPVELTGRSDLSSIRWRLPVASAQIKGAILLAALAAAGRTEIEEPIACRDHSERLLPLYGAKLATEKLATGGKLISLEGKQPLRSISLSIAGDPSTAAFLVVAQLLCGTGELVLENVGVNPLRTGLFETLLEMGAEIQIEPEATGTTGATPEATDTTGTTDTTATTDTTGTTDTKACGEPTATLRVWRSALRGVVVPSERVATMIDEYPILAVAAACAEGRTRMEGLDELRHKESDRLAAIATGLQAVGVAIELAGDDLVVLGTGKPPQGGATIESRRDHRIAMAFLVLGLATAEPIKVLGTEWIATSFPNFREVMESLGAKFESARV